MPSVTPGLARHAAARVAVVTATPPAALDLRADLVTLTRAVCDVPSESGDETVLADLVEAALRAYPHLEVLRDGDTVVARTHLGRPSRVCVAGHLDTVPIVDNVPTRLEGDGDDAVLWGRGTVDMKAGVAVQLALAAELTDPVHDVTWVFYDHEEVAADLNGLGRVVREHPEWLACDFAVLCEPTDGGLEGGCNGTLRAEVRLTGVAAHSARAWMGRNAIHAAGEVLRRLEAYEPAHVEVDGLTYRESLNAVLVSGGTAANVIPDACVVTVNYRFAPSKDVEQATRHVRDLLDGYDVVVTDAAPGARPGLDHPAAAAFADVVLAVTGGVPAAKLGWTDVARFTALGVPAVNFGPGDPLLAHKDDERCPVEQIRTSHAALRAWLTT
ncbi:succinyl-diaminopimelate desuccinylase [Cellulomonas biazotea]|uniref:Succinyl-diaminopimelate desuccinylase n=1 Tax=Cellulomonas biazotea TaxID=1709 RepID=A0A402DS48_9CELL|nr:succinyl-diaminopimelate desuccinylase [Cellulomonas biazotea]